jgi:hypothetical protein
MADLKHRAAELTDLKDIWGLLRQTANDIPFDLESEADQENVLTERTNPSRSRCFGFNAYGNPATQSSGACQREKRKSSWVRGRAQKTWL